MNELYKEYKINDEFYKNKEIILYSQYLPRFIKIKKTESFTLKFNQSYTCYLSDNCMTNLNLILSFKNYGFELTENFYYDMFDSIQILIGGNIIDKITDLKLTEYLTNKKINIKYTKEEIIIKIPLLFDCIMKPNFLSNIDFHRIDIYFKLNPFYFLLKDELTPISNIDVKGHINYELLDYDKKYAKRNGIQGKRFWINQYQNFVEFVSNTNKIDIKLYYNLCIHYIIFKFCEDFCLSDLESVNLLINENNYNLNIYELRNTNWKKIGLKVPNDNYFLIPFCYHKPNNYGRNECTAINFDEVKTITVRKKCALRFNRLKNHNLKHPRLSITFKRKINTKIFHTCINRQEVCISCGMLGLTNLDLQSK